MSSSYGSSSQIDTNKALKRTTLSKAETALSSASLAQVERTGKEIDGAVARHDTRRSYYDIKVPELPLSPVRQLPPEILSEIFVLLSETIKVPPKLTQVPLILGRVCSRWRTISRRDPRLWGHPTIDLNDASINSIEFLERALDIFPPAVHIDLHCFEKGVNPKGLDRYLNRCRLIALGGTVKFINDIFQSAPRNAFQNLVIIHLSIHRFIIGSKNSQGSVSGPALAWGHLLSAIHLEELKLDMCWMGGEFQIESLNSLGSLCGQLRVLKIDVNN
ncbi:hypothetical protein C0995_012681 [Termitomyces sp. Mi166|nr:hypothetical protein C0995_012681 [Termitomyces sp. Mi166\